MDGVTTVPDSGVPPVNWWPTADGYAHAFRGMSDYTLSLCSREWWRVPVPTDAVRCPDCALLAEGAPITESELRLMDGNR